MASRGFGLTPDPTGGEQEVRLTPDTADVEMQVRLKPDTTDVSDGANRTSASW